MKKKYTTEIDEFDSEEEYYYNEAYEEIQNDAEDVGETISAVASLSTWFIRIGVVLMIILIIYFIVTGKVLTALIYVIGLVVAYFFGYFFMYFLDYFVSRN